jgi:hypothetical protein
MRLQALVFRVTEVAMCKSVGAAAPLDLEKLSVAIFLGC